MLAELGPLICVHVPVPVAAITAHTVPVQIYWSGPATGVDGAVTVTAKEDAAVVTQALLAVTVMFPFCPATPVVTVIEFVPAPAVIIQPVGTVQL